MAPARTYRAPRGTSDILPEDQPYWSHVYRAARKVAAKFGYSRIDTPMFEATELFERGVGDETDIVQKEMYTFEDHGGDSMTLRPEGTASVCRAYMEHGMHNRVQPVRLYYMAPMFRYERPQAGRVRQHHQFGVEAIGDQSPLVDAELIELGWKYLTDLGLSDFTLRLNSLGDRADRAPYEQALRDYYAPFADRLPKVARDRLERAPLRLLDSKEPDARELAADAPKSVDFLGEDAAAHWEQLLLLLDGLRTVYSGFSYSVDHRLARGLDYYNRTVFEFEPKGAGGQRTLIAGGRYDPLIEILGGNPTPGIGFGSGIERIIIELRSQEVPVDKPRGIDVVVVHLGEDAGDIAMRTAAELRAAGTSVIVAPPKSMKAQMRYANSASARFALIMGSREIERGVVALKSMVGGEQIEVTLNAAEIVRAIDSATGESATGES